MMLRSFAEIYRGLLYSLLGNGVREKNERTQTEVAIMPGGCGFTLDLSSQRMPTPGCRRVYPKTAAVEVAWFLSGSDNTAFLQAHKVKIWNKFLEDDGVTVRGAYGYRWRQAFGRDQIALAVEALKTDPSDRRVKISAWDAREDGLGAKGQKNVPCPTDFTFCVVGDVLHSTVLLRSSDVFVGLPYDVMGHSILCALMANSLNIPMGTLQMSLAHAHLYECHYEMAFKCLQQDHIDDSPLLPQASTIESVTEAPDNFVEVYGKACREVKALPSYDPKPGIVA